MAAADILCKIESLLVDSCKERSGSLKETQTEMSLDIKDYGRRYLLYSFDKGVKRGKGEKILDLQPYFKANKGVKSMCDYFLFCWEGGKLYVLLIELKQGEEQITCQLDAGNCFASYIVSSLNRVEKLSIIPIIRKISIRDYHIAKKGTAMKSVEYNDKSFCAFEGSVFHLLEFLK